MRDHGVMTASALDTRSHGWPVLGSFGPGLHFLPEDRPVQMAGALVDWLSGLPAGR